eukprot:767958-Hanusia_phi.AAC.6
MALSVIKDPKVRLRQHTFWVRSVHWSPDGQLLATGSADKNLRAFDLEGNEVYKYAETCGDGCVNSVLAGFLILIGFGMSSFTTLPRGRGLRQHAWTGISPTVTGYPGDLMSAAETFGSWRQRMDIR